ncbi:hypothetical protein D9M70_587790 [compost metagenome]
MRFDQIHDPVGRLPVIHAYHDDFSLVGARMMQDVETRSIAIKSLESEPPSFANTVGISLDNRNIRSLGKEQLRRNLSEAPEADHQYPAFEIVRGFNAFERRRFLAQKPGTQKQHKRCNGHRQNDDG